MALTQVQPGMLGTPQPYSFKNRIINGSCLIAQRGSVTLSSNASLYGGCDRWFLASTGFSTVSAVMSQAGSVGSGASNSGYVQQYFVTTTGSGSLSIQQRIESYNCADLNSKSVTISLSLYQDTGSILSPTINLYKPTAQDNYTSTTFINGTSVSLPSGVRTTFTYTVALGSSDATNGLALVIIFPIGAVTNKYIQIGDVQLEVGVTATTFDYRAYGDELLLCQRYYTRFTAGSPFGGIIAGGSAWNAPITFNPPLRTTATTANTSISNVSDWTIHNAVANIAFTGFNISSDTATNSSIQLNLTGLAAGGTTGQYGHLRAFNGSSFTNTAWIAFSAEL